MQYQLCLSHCQCLLVFPLVLLLVNTLTGSYFVEKEREMNWRQRCGAVGVHHQRQYSDNFLETWSNGRWLQSGGLQHLQSSNNAIPPLQDYEFFGGGGGGQRPRVYRNVQRGFNGGNEFYAEPTTPPVSSRKSSQREWRRLPPNPDAAFFKKLDGFQPCEITELKAGPHVFSVYGDNFFKSVSYKLEVLLCCSFYTRNGGWILGLWKLKFCQKRGEISKFETEYKEVLAQFTEMTSTYAQEMQKMRLFFIPMG